MRPLCRCRCGCRKRPNRRIWCRWCCPPRKIGPCCISSMHSDSCHVCIDEWYYQQPDLNAQGSQEEVSTTTAAAGDEWYYRQPDLNTQGSQWYWWPDLNAQGSQEEVSTTTRMHSHSRITNPPSVQIRSRGQRFAADCNCWLCSFCSPLQHCRCGSFGRCQSINCRARHR